MRTSLRVWFLVLVGLLISVASRAQSGQGVAINFEESAVVASGLSPGKSVVWFGVERLVDAAYSSDLYEHSKVDTAAADGTARLALDRPVAAASIWVAVDLGTGAYAVTAPVISHRR